MYYGFQCQIHIKERVSHFNCLLTETKPMIVLVPGHPTSYFRNIFLAKETVNALRYPHEKEVHNCERLLIVKTNAIHHQLLYYEPDIQHTITEH